MKKTRRAGSIVLTAAALACSTTDGEGVTTDSPSPERPIQAVLADWTESWMTVPGVTGTGIGLCEGEPCLVVFVARDTEAVRSRIPDNVEGYAVDFRVSGPFRARDSLDGSADRASG